MHQHAINISRLSIKLNCRHFRILQSKFFLCVMRELWGWFNILKTFNCVSVCPYVIVDVDVCLYFYSAWNCNAFILTAFGSTVHIEFVTYAFFLSTFLQKKKKKKLRDSMNCFSLLFFFIFWFHVKTRRWRRAKKKLFFCAQIHISTYAFVRLWRAFLSFNFSPVLLSQHIVELLNPWLKIVFN